MKKVSSVLGKIARVAAQGPFTASWQSLSSFIAPRWYEDAKFGIFIHWGVYSVPAFGNEWYPRRMYLKDDACFQHHVETYGPQSRFGYKDFVPLFKAEKYDPAQWAALFKQAGAKYVVPVAEHHDGFAMYDCSFSRWTAAKMGPKRDVVGELAEAVRREGMVFGLSSHRAEHWWFMNGGREFDSDVSHPRYQDFYGPASPRPTTNKDKDAQPRPSADYLNDWLARTCELVDKYQPQVVWFDWWIEQAVFAPYVQTFAAYYYNSGHQWQQGVAINYKNEAFPPEAAVYDIERGQLKGINPHFWQTDTSISKNSWGYVERQEYKTPASLIHDLIDIVSKNGTLLLNIGPRPDGTIPEPEQAILLEMGRWLSVNGEAIYETRPWTVYGEGPTEVHEGGFTDTKRQAFTPADIRFTTKGKTLFALLLGWPADRVATIRTLGSQPLPSGASIKRISLLGSDQPLRWSLHGSGLKITLPATKPCDHAFVLKIE